MAKYLINDTTLNEIACAIRSKCGKNDPIKVCEFADEIENITSNAPDVYNPPSVEELPTEDVKEGSVSIIENTVYVYVNGEWSNEGYIKPEGSITITKNSTVDVTDKAEVVVDVPVPDGYIKPEGSITITKNSTVDVTDKAEVVVDVPDNPIPDVIDSAEEMIALSETKQVGSIYKYIGETTEDYRYEKDCCYILTENEGFLKLYTVAEIEDNPLPVKVESEAEMNALLETATVGEVYKYIGETGTYENGALYVVEEA